MMKEKDSLTSKENVFVDTVISVKRVTKVTKGGKRFSFSAVVVSGDQKGNVGIGAGKSWEVSSAISKATSRARKLSISIALRGDTIPYEVSGRHGSAQVLVRAASKGTGLVAGKAARAVMRAAGVKDVFVKVIKSSRCSPNVVKATLNALSKVRTIEKMAWLRDKSIGDLLGKTDKKGSTKAELLVEGH